MGFPRTALTYITAAFALKVAADVISPDLTPDLARPIDVEIFGNPIVGHYFTNRGRDDLVPRLGFVIRDLFVWWAFHPTMSAACASS